MRLFSRKTAPPRRRRRIRKLRLLALLTVLGLLASVAFTFGLIRAVASEIPKLDPAKAGQSQVNGYIYASNGRSILSVLRGTEARTLVDYEEISPLMRQAIVAIEDQRFFEHRGVDVRGIARALWADIRQQAVVEGGSTITQQFVKNTYVRNQRSIARKVREAALAWQLEQRWSKERILTAYLNTIYFGNGAYGIQQAALVYFGKGASKLDLHEAALLAGIPADPTRYDPVTHPRDAKSRRRAVLQAMLEQSDITLQDFARATTAPLPDPGSVQLPGTQGPAPYFVNYVKQQLVDEYGAARVFGGGLRVTTTIDLELQDLARKAIARHLTDPEGPSAALVAIDPRDGSIRAMVGGNNYRRSQFNLAVQAERQPGSAFKPIVLATALRAGIAPATRFESKPQLISLGDKFWSVTNYDDSYADGPIDLVAATTASDNSVYAQLTQLVGPAAIVRTAHALGIRSTLSAYFALGLGAEAVNPLEMARAYATFANHGLRVDGSLNGDRPRAIASVAGENGKPIAENRPVGRQALTEAEAAVLTSILQRVVSEGTGRRAALKDRPAAGKTGTTENYGDAWFVGYTPQLVTAVWVGYPNKLVPMLTEFHGRAVSGSTFPAEIWKTYTETALRQLDERPESFDPPPPLSVTPRLVVWRNGKLRLDNGYCKHRSEVVYFTGKGPTLEADCKPNEVEVPRVIGLPVQTAKERLALQPLTPKLVFTPAEPKQVPGVVVNQFPKRGFLSTYDPVTIVVAKPTNGVVPNVVGDTLGDAREKLRKLKLTPRLLFVDGKAGQVVGQAPRAGVAAAPGLTVTLVVGRD